jgi:RNA polymerase sigma-70 factor (ECF subfamily)
VDAEHAARFERILREHGPALSRVVASYAKPGADQDDLGQEVALALWRALPRFRDECPERAFALRVAHNRGLNHLWRKKPAEEIPAELMDGAPSPELRLARLQEGESLFNAIRDLPLLQRQVLTLALEDLSHAEIGEVLGITAENVAVRLSRARATLRERMKKESTP